MRREPVIAISGRSYRPAVYPTHTKDVVMPRVDKKTLEAQRDAALEEIEHLRMELESSEVDPSVDEGDPDVVEREKTVALLGAMERRLEEIEHALSQAASGSYGKCEVCGGKIDPERLKIMPEATMCVSCKAATEKRRSAGMPTNRAGPDDW